VVWIKRKGKQGKKEKRNQGDVEMGMINNLY
jgi:hypothetical protein